VEARPLGCSTDMIGKVVIETTGTAFFKNTVFNEHRAPYYSFGNRNEEPFIHGRNRKPTSFTVSAVVHDKEGEIMLEDSINFSFSSTACASSCVSTEGHLRAQLSTAAEGSTILICENTSIEIDVPLTTNTNSLTLACAGENCALSKKRSILLKVYGKEFSLEGISFLNEAGSDGTLLKISSVGPHTISNCEFRGAKSVNVASVQATTGIREGGAGSMTIQNTVFAENESSGVFLQGFDDVRVVGCTFDSNVGRHLNVRPPEISKDYGQTVNIEDSSFIDSLTTWEGPGVAIWKYFDIQIKRSMFANNMGLRGTGGGLSVFGSISNGLNGADRPEKLTVSDCTFISNENERSGALHYGVGTSYPVTLSLLNNVFEDNTNKFGGAISTSRGRYASIENFTLIAEGNMGVGNTACDGVFDNNEQKCYPFE